MLIKNQTPQMHPAVNCDMSTIIVSKTLSYMFEIFTENHVSDCQMIEISRAVINAKFSPRHDAPKNLTLVILDYISKLTSTDYFHYIDDDDTYSSLHAKLTCSIIDTFITFPKHSPDDEIKYAASIADLIFDPPSDFDPSNDALCDQISCIVDNIIVIQKTYHTDISYSSIVEYCDKYKFAHPIERNHVIETVCDKLVNSVRSLPVTVHTNKF